MSKLKNNVLKQRTIDLTERMDMARGCRLIGVELRDLGRLMLDISAHMRDLQMKVDGQAEHIKNLEAKLAEKESAKTTDPIIED